VLTVYFALGTSAHAVDLPEGPEGAVVRFHAAIAAGDRDAALALLAPDAMIIENGKTESRAVYAAQHLAADVDFARGTTVERTESRTVVEGDTAWVVSMNKVRGHFKGRPVNLITAELVVLTQRRGLWLIRAIHWSSRPP